jgi:hypothetical protein
MRLYQCDACGLYCERIHHLTAYGMDTACCDMCCGHDPAAYDEPADRIRTAKQERLPDGRISFTEPGGHVWIIRVDTDPGECPF